jgi:thiamine biosynthesis lipoprotein
MDTDGAAPRRDGTADGALAIEDRPGLRDVRRASHQAMATVFEVHAVHPDERYAAQAAQAAFDLVDRLERELSRFLPNSDVSRINRLAAGSCTRVSPSTMECLIVARHMFTLTDGAFDVSIGTGLASLELDPDDVVVRAASSGVAIDLGGIGKGYAVDRMAELLEEWGLRRALVHGGFSSVVALDPPHDRDGWPLTLSDPGEPSRVLARLSTRQAALGASGVRKGDHIVDPRTGVPAEGRRAAWATLPRPEASPSAEAAAPAFRIAAAAVADALTTAFMLMRVEEIEALCERSPGLEAWLLEEQPPGQHQPASLRRIPGPGASMVHE